MRAIKLAAAALVLAGASVSVPVHGQSDPVFDSMGKCNSYLKQVRKSASRGANLAEAASWEAAYCWPVAFKQYVIVFPF